MRVSMMWKQMYWMKQSLQMFCGKVVANPAELSDDISVLNDLAGQPDMVGYL